MREIEFRGYVKYKNKWVYGMLDKFNNKYFINDGSDTKPYVEKDSIGQYTGFKDKNGKEIYEGDIIKGNCEEDYYDVNYTVKFSSDGEWIGVHEDKDSLIKKLNLSIICGCQFNPEVIGNIYEEKLKEDK